MTRTDGGLIDYGEYIASPGSDVFAGSELVTTGHMAGYYENGTLTCRTVVKYGDTDYDGLCDARDAIIALCIANGMLAQAPAAQEAAADFDRDGTADENDYHLICACGLTRFTV